MKIETKSSVYCSNMSVINCKYMKFNKMYKTFKFKDINNYMDVNYV